MAEKYLLGHDAYIQGDLGRVKGPGGTHNVVQVYRKNDGSTTVTLGEVVAEYSNRPQKSKEDFYKEVAEAAKFYGSLVTDETGFNHNVTEDAEFEIVETPIKELPALIAEQGKDVEAHFNKLKMDAPKIEDNE